MSEFDDLGRPGFLTDAVYTTVKPGSSDTRFAVFCEDCNRTVQDGLTEPGAFTEADLHRRTCSNKGRTVDYVV